MKIITRGKKIAEYSQVEGILTVDDAEGVFWLKLTYDSGKSQCIVALSKFEVARIINVGLEDAQIVAACKRQKPDLMKDFLKNLEEEGEDKDGK